MPKSKKTNNKNEKRGTVLGKKKEGRSLKKKRGTVLEEKNGDGPGKEKKRDGPGRKKRGTVLEIRIKDRPPFFIKLVYIY